MSWPLRGVYFFHEQGEYRSTSGEGLRVVRVGTHALNEKDQSTLWQRLRQHRGTMKNSGGNHRGSVFRKHVGFALMNRDIWPYEIARSWGKDSSAPKSVREVEKPLEKVVSACIFPMPILWLKVDDPPGPETSRDYFERNSIALLSNYLYQHNPIDSPSGNWLGRFSKSEEICKSGLWNVKHVKENYDPDFLRNLSDFVHQLDWS